MGSFWTTLHVIAVVLVIGPMCAAPFFARRAISRRSADNVRAATRQLTLFGSAAAVAGALGVVAASTSDRYHLRTPWVIISITLFLLALALVFGYTAPALAKAARMIGDSEDDENVTDDPDGGSDEAVAFGRRDRARTRLDVIGGRVGGSGLLILLDVVAVTVLMVVKPFGA
jgi:uncharacterized membrane protein